MMKDSPKLIALALFLILQGCTMVASYTEARATCAGVADGYYPLGQCVSNYYACISGTLYDLNCPSGTVFDDASTQCVNSNQCITTVPTTTKKPFDCVGAPDGNYAIGTSCSSNYYSCLAGAMYPQTCPAGVFDPVRKQCVSYSLSSCATTTPLATTTTTSEITTTAPETTTTTPETTTTTPETTTTTPETTSTTPETTTTTPETTTTIPETTTTTPETTTTTPETTTTTPETTTTTPETTTVAGPTTAAPYVCLGAGTYHIPDYCGPDYYSCSAAGASPTNSTCPNEPYNYFDSTSSSCLSCAQAACVIAQSGYVCPVQTTLPPPTPPPTTSPVICPTGSAGKFYQIRNYCGPDYYYCSADGEVPKTGTCNYPTLNYFDCTGCKDKTLVGCDDDPPAPCANIL